MENKSDTKTRQEYTHRVVDPQKNNAIMGKYTSLKAATRAKDRLDNQYGGYRYKHEQIPNIVQNNNNAGMKRGGSAKKSQNW